MGSVKTRNRLTLHFSVKFPVEDDFTVPTTPSRLYNFCFRGKQRFCTEPSFILAERKLMNVSTLLDAMLPAPIANESIKEFK